tara:strand:+ start:152 stop:256 length:105 start_codon:yes stop_codon:yes gene_type:complete
MKDKLWMQLTYVALWGSIPLCLSLVVKGEKIYEN